LAEHDLGGRVLAKELLAQPVLGDDEFVIEFFVGGELAYEMKNSWTVGRRRPRRVCYEEIIP